MPGYIDQPLGPEGTIYEKEQGFDSTLRIDIDPAKLAFIQTLKKSEASSIFHVTYEGEHRVLKVFHNDRDPGYADDGFRDLNRARCEIRAYCRLKQSGVCDRGYVPQFYGYNLSLDLEGFPPILDSFRRDSAPPNVILMEYLPNPLLMNCITYSKERMAKAVESIQQIHSALILHNDTYPKNIVIVPGEPERVMWIDFDIAITFPDHSRRIRDKDFHQIPNSTS
ncbi:hypothetical protein BDV25DRAFT_127189 [Aspergillus avenaceus]|uniref:Protein kinase domain-containing protein n=1 Tax=Aspergillus avenaceus TaxID=36643 RepID=A0A5N6U4U0_ASPAV|nr:hypothetical protein BDV25DRAFT_127189 [Aspergillus avenaceus]